MLGADVDESYCFLITPNWQLSKERLVYESNNRTCSIELLSHVVVNLGRYCLGSFDKHEIRLYH